MDELLPSPQGPLSAPARKRREHMTRSFFRRGFSLPVLPNFLERRSRKDPAIFLGASLSLCAAALLFGVYTPCCRVTVGERELPMADRPSAQAAVAQVEADASQILGHPYVLPTQPAYSLSLALRGELLPQSQVEDSLFELIDEITEATVLSIDGTDLGAVRSMEALQAVLDDIQAPYVTENTISVQFAEPLTLQRRRVALESLWTPEQAKSFLTADKVPQAEYVVQEGDTFSEIANSHGMTVEALSALNPTVAVDQLSIGQSLILTRAAPFLSVQTVDNISYDAPVPFEVQEVPDDTLYEGDSVILTPGVDGTAVYNADVTYLNGVETGRTINYSQVYAQPVAQVVAVGTKPRPKTTATGQFAWPITGTITSGFGRRNIFGSTSTHNGIDIASPYGSSVLAADGGKVVFAGKGTGYNWSYGNYVMIDHENGFVTIYAHCSSVDVSAGDRVYQGQLIARVGSTGRSTGNHCHFQVKKNGTSVNPFNYLP